MSDLNRRTFLKTTAAAATSVAAGAGAVAACATEGAAGSPNTLNHRTLLAVAQVVLPEELGEDGIARATTGLEDWVADYRPAVELTHGYGTGNLEYTPAHPGPGWAAQLDALDLEARARFGSPFAALSRDQRDGMIRQQLAREREERLPDPAQARHVAIGLLAWWARTPEATNLCYQASIDPYSCRPLARQVQQPSALETES
jgi:hypothetical protein